MYYIDQAQDAAQRRKPKILEFFDWFNFFTELFYALQDIFRS